MYRTIYHRNFRRLRRLIPDLERLRPRERLRFEAPGQPDLLVDVLGRQEESLHLSMAHFEQVAGQPEARPEILVRADLATGSAEALTWLDGDRYRAVYPSQGRTSVDRELRRILNHGLADWLCNLYVQGHRLAT